jgi:hypothetical protein
LFIFWRDVEIERLFAVFQYLMHFELDAMSSSRSSIFQLTKQAFAESIFNFGKWGGRIYLNVRHLQECFSHRPLFWINNLLRKRFQQLSHESTRACKRIDVLLNKFVIELSLASLFSRRLCPILIHLLFQNLWRHRPRTLNRILNHRLTFCRAPQKIRVDQPSWTCHREWSFHFSPKCFLFFLLFLRCLLFQVL